jgi:hypothetical protein
MQTSPNKHFNRLDVVIISREWTKYKGRFCPVRRGGKSEERGLDKLEKGVLDLRPQSSRHSEQFGYVDTSEIYSSPTGGRPML